jgi:hypothetical protein
MERTLSALGGGSSLLSQYYSMRDGDVLTMVLAQSPLLIQSKEHEILQLSKLSPHK